MDFLSSFIRSFYILEDLKNENEKRGNVNNKLFSTHFTNFLYDGFLLTC